MTNINARSVITPSYLDHLMMLDASGSPANIPNRALLNDFRDMVNVLDYGADKTGVSDSSSAFTAAAAAADTRSGGIGGAIYIPEGEYLVEDIPLVTSTAPYAYTWVGAGKGCTILRPNSNAANTHLFTMSRDGTLRGGGIFDLSMVGDNTLGLQTENGAVEADFRDSNQTAVHMDLVSSGTAQQIHDWTMQNVDIRAFRYGYRQINGRSRSNRFVNCSFWECWVAFNANEHPLFGGGINDFRNCWSALTHESGQSLFDCRFIGLKIVGCAYGTGYSNGTTITDAVTLSNNSFVGCTIATCHEVSIVLTTGSQVVGCYFVGTGNNTYVQAANGIIVRGDHTVIEGNFFNSTGYEYTSSVIELDASSTSIDNITIANNVFRGSTSRLGLPINCAGSNNIFGVIVANNVLYGGNGTGTQFFDGSATRVSYLNLCNNYIRTSSYTGPISPDGPAVLLTGTNTRNNVIANNNFLLGSSASTAFAVEGIMDYSVYVDNVVSDGAGSDMSIASSFGGFNEGTTTTVDFGSAHSFNDGDSVHVATLVGGTSAAHIQGWVGQCKVIDSDTIELYNLDSSDASGTISVIMELAGINLTSVSFSSYTGARFATNTQYS